MERRLSTFNLAAIPKIGTCDLDVADEKKMSPKDWFQDIQYYLIGLLYLSSRLIYMALDSYIVYYVEFTLRLEKEFKAIVPLVMFTSGFVIAAIVEIVKRYVSMKIIFIGSCILGLGTDIFVLILPSMLSNINCISKFASFLMSNIYS